MDAGLEKIVAAETVLSCIDGENGRLIIRGEDVETLSARSGFEDVLHRLWQGFFEGLPDNTSLARALGEARLAAHLDLKGDFHRLAKTEPMEALRSGLALGIDGHDLATAIAAVARAGVLTATLSRIRAGFEPVRPDPDLNHAEDMLSMMTGEPVSSDLVRGLNAYLVTVAEHGLNASTFAARVVASTQAGLLSAVIAGLSALKGPLHGGAPGPVLDMLDGIGEAANAERWINDALDRGDRLMGFGHRVYRTRDPRADALKRAATSLPQSKGRLALAQTIETEILDKLEAAKPDRRLETNVEYYTAILLEALGFDRTAFTSVFGCARIAGWVAHAQEQLATRRIVRPSSVYVGPAAPIAA